jgi:hypothetical protein
MWTLPLQNPYPIKDEKKGKNAIPYLFMGNPIMNKYAHVHMRCIIAQTRTPEFNHVECSVVYAHQ